MSGYLLAFLTIVGGLFAAAVGDMVSEEVRDRFDHVPHAILKLAASRLDASHRAAIYDDEWLPELTYILQGDEARPVSRVYHGTRYALGILTAARQIARDLHRSVPLAESQLRPFQTAVRAEQPEFDDRRDLEEPAAEATVLRMLLGAQLRRLREAVGITAEAAGYEIRASRSKISRMETGRVGFKVRDIEDLLTLYGVLDEKKRAKVIALASRSREPEWWTQYNDVLPDWFETYLGLESAAVAIRSFEAQFVPDLFQTEEYARAVTALGHRALSDREIERRVGLRLRRQDLLARREPPRVWAVIDEAVLRRPIDGAAVMRGQLDRLVEMARLPQVTLQVVPFALGAHAAASGSFSILRFGERDLPDVVYMEQLTSAIYLDQRPDVEHYLEVVDHLSGWALTPADSIRFIEQIARDYDGKSRNWRRLLASLSLR
jgi:transcriptional regulator with XRE-family HTH domain